MSGYRSIDHREALELLDADAVTILDVRSPEEFDKNGHLPGAWLLPANLIASAPAVIPRGRPVLVYCEHGVRSAASAEMLVKAGVNEVLNLASGLASWTGPRTFGRAPLHGPSSWLIQNADLLPRGGKVLDVACGKGRHALLIAAAGFEVEAIDRDPEAIAFLRETAANLDLRIDARVVDLESDPPPNIGADFDLVLVFNFLHRALVPALQQALRPGGSIFCETFTTRQAGRGHPKNPAFLLREGELAQLMAPLTIVRSREGDIDGKYIASIVAERQ